jgi:uncharacterized protein (TIGR00369 family)
MDQMNAEELAALMNQNRDGWSRATGLRYVRASPDEVIVEWDVRPEHLQAYGIVHGGVHAGVIETIASVGAALSAMSRGQHVVGLENHTSFLRAVREGTLRAVARPILRGRSTQVWEGTVSDAEGKAVASGRVRLLCLAGDATLAGSKVTLQTEETPERKGT